MALSRAKLSDDDIHHLKAVIDLAVEIARQGASPFTARLVTQDGKTRVDAINSVRESGDVTGHAETNLLRKLGDFDREDLRTATLYASCEPCAMCAAAICWSQVGRVVYALSHGEMRQYHPATSREPGIGGMELFRKTAGAPQVLGPVPEVNAHRPFQLEKE